MHRAAAVAPVSQPEVWFLACVTTKRWCSVGDACVTPAQTTNRIFDERLLDLIQPPSALSWQRVRAALAVAPDGPAWAQAVRTHNSGTYT